MNNNDSLYTFIDKLISLLIPGIEYNVYQIADISIDNIRYVIIINNEFKIDINVNRYKVTFDLKNTFLEVSETIKSRIDFYKNRFLKIRKIKNIIDDKNCKI